MMRYCVLGSGAGGAPILSRHPAAVLVRVEGALLLLDCGEGTQRQLLRLGVSRNRIDLIAITHLHGDHVLGLVPLLTSMHSDRRRRPLLLIRSAGAAGAGGGHLAAHLHRACLPAGVPGAAEGFAGGVVETPELLLDCAPLQHSVPCFGYRVEQRLAVRLDPARLAAYGITPGPLVGQLKREGQVRLPDGKVVRLEDCIVHRIPPSLVYCGDTRPCDAAVELARGAQVLLYEATFGREHAELALETMHSTAEEAAQRCSTGRGGDARADALQRSLPNGRRACGRSPCNLPVDHRGARAGVGGAPPTPCCHTSAAVNRSFSGCPYDCSDGSAQWGRCAHPLDPAFG
jgi:ribonuclease Z